MIIGVGEWGDRASCLDGDPDLHFGGDEETTSYRERHRMRKRAIRVCLECPVQSQCLETVLRIDRELGVQYGVWGGLDAGQRRVLLRESMSVA